MADIRVRVGTENGIKVTASNVASDKYWQVNNNGIYRFSNVGIGTTNPTSKLWVDGNGYFTGILTAQRIISSLYGEFSGSVNATNIVGTSLSISGISTFTNGPVFIGIGTSSQPLQVSGGAYISGSIGIGTTNPQQSLDVIGNIQLGGQLIVNDNAGISTVIASIGTDRYLRNIIIDCGFY